MATTADRRTFLRKSTLIAGGAIVAPSLSGLVACNDFVAPTSPGGKILPRATRGGGGYGPLFRAGPELALPEGFQYVKFGVEGTPMSDGNVTPKAHDGMAAFEFGRSREDFEDDDDDRDSSEPERRIRLIRNHEMRGAGPAFGNPALAYDARGSGGTTTLEVLQNKDGSLVCGPGGQPLVRDWVSLGGTHVNCAGGRTPWQSWITSEETFDAPSASGTSFQKGHGYNFDVPVWADGQVQAVHLPALGRFSHEAVAVDPRSGIIYETEDRRYRPRTAANLGAGFYRYIPDSPGDLHHGVLEMLKIRGVDNYNTTSGQTVGRPLDVEWVRIDDPDPQPFSPDGYDVYRQGFAKGGAIFDRLEGCWYGDASIYFVVTNGGDAELGQVWQYRPRGLRSGVLTLIFESPRAEVLDGPDNICVSPRGGLILCEDGDDEQYLRGLTPHGEIFDFALNLYNDNEFAGACFSPNGKTLFVNFQGSTSPATPPGSNPAALGMTFAIWGPWKDGAL
jgi:secreted PhoX family phosphatase